MATRLKKVVVLRPEVGVYTAVVTAGSRLSKGSPTLLPSHLYVMLPFPVAEAKFVKGGGVSFSQTVADT